MNVNLIKEQKAKGRLLEKDIATYLVLYRKNNEVLRKPLETQISILTKLRDTAAAAVVNAQDAANTLGTDITADLLPKRGPGRPPKSAVMAAPAPAKRGPGRPKGVKNKPKVTPAPVQATEQHAPAAA